MSKAGAQLVLPGHGGWGGRRKGAGRKRRGHRPSTAHRRRADHVGREPVHVTMRAKRLLPSFRAQTLRRAVEGSIGGAQRADFSVAHYSIQRDHLHLMVEAATTAALSAGMRGLAIRIAQAINRTLRRRGKVWGDRWNGRALSSPREVRNALVYILFNGQKHGEVRHGLDACTSIHASPDVLSMDATRLLVNPDRPPPTRAPRTWLLCVGWRRHGLLSMADARRMLRSG